MAGPADESGREPTDGVARIWQLYADEIGLPDASAADRTLPSPESPRILQSTPPRHRLRRRRVGLGVAAVASVVVAAVVLVIGLGQQPRMLVDSDAHRAPSSDPEPVRRADEQLVRAAPTALHPTVPLSVSATEEASNGGHVDQPGQAAKSPSPGATSPVASPDTAAAPARTPAAERKPRLILPQQITFDFDSDVLTAESKRIVDKVAVAMKANPDWQLTIAGHTDAHGPPSYNMALSERRAQAAKAYLESAGISAQRLRASGFAGSRPLAPNDTPLTFLNRRVEFHRR